MTLQMNTNVLSTNLNAINIGHAFKVVGNQEQEQVALLQASWDQTLLCVLLVVKIRWYGKLQNFRRCDNEAKDSQFFFTLLAEIPYCSVEIH